MTTYATIEKQHAANYIAAGVPLAHLALSTDGEVVFHFASADVEAYEKRRTHAVEDLARIAHERRQELIRAEIEAAWRTFDEAVQRRAAATTAAEKAETGAAIMAALAKVNAVKARWRR